MNARGNRWPGLMLVALFAACGGSSGEPQAPATAATATSATTATTPGPSDPHAAGVDGPGYDDEGPDEEGGCPPGMGSVPAGTLWLGSPDGQGKADEHPRTAKEVKAFCLDVSEVSVSDYQACVKNAVCDAVPNSVEGSKLKPEEQEKKSALCSARLGDPDLALSCVTEEAAIFYCKWKGLRLPSEIEIEWAASGGGDKLPYPWGTSPPDDNKACWQKDKPCKVRTRPAGAFGIQDLSGNLSEWTSTKYGPYPNPPETGDKVVVRGASFRATKPEEMQAQRRSWRDPATASVDVGFRCAKDR